MDGRLDDSQNLSWNCIVVDFFLYMCPYICNFSEIIEISDILWEVLCAYYVSV